MSSKNRVLYIAEIDAEIVEKAEEAAKSQGVSNGELFEKYAKSVLIVDTGVEKC
jgi:hypothetical protein